MSEEEILDRKWWQKQRSWAMVLGIIGTVCGFVPATAAFSAPVLAVAGLLGFKGLSDAQDRTERIAAVNSAKLSVK